MVAAAGNAGTSVPMLPAAHKVAVAIGGLNEDQIPVAWSNHGPWVDFSALATLLLRPRASSNATRETRSISAVV